MKWKCPQCGKEYSYEIDPFPKLEIIGDEIIGFLTLVANCYKCGRRDIKKARIKGKIVEIFENG